jgi:hypothetical protein
VLSPLKNHPNAYSFLEFIGEESFAHSQQRAPASMNIHTKTMAKSTSLLGTETLQKAIDEVTSNMQSWDAIVPFPVILPVLAGLCPTLLSCDNILEYTKPKYRGQKVHFCKSTYPLHNGWEALKTDLEKAALEQGTAIISNGSGTGNARNCKKLVCTCSRVYRKGHTDTSRRTRVRHRWRTSLRAGFAREIRQSRRLH